MNETDKLRMTCVASLIKALNDARRDPDFKQYLNMTLGEFIHEIVGPNSIEFRYCKPKVPVDPVKLFALANVKHPIRPPQNVAAPPTGNPEYLNPGMPKASSASWLPPIKHPELSVAEPKDWEPEPPLKPLPQGAYPNPGEPSFIPPPWMPPQIITKRKSTVDSTSSPGPGVQSDEISPVVELTPVIDEQLW